MDVIDIIDEYKNGTKNEIGVRKDLGLERTFNNVNFQRYLKKKDISILFF